MKLDSAWLTKAVADAAEAEELLPATALAGHPELSFYQQADALVRSLTLERVDEIMDRVPPEFRSVFIKFAREAYLPSGPRMVLGGIIMPESCLDAIRGWLKRYDADH